MNQPSTAGTVMMLSGDLMFSSKVKVAAQNAGLQFKLGGSLPDSELPEIRFVVLDLSTRSGLLPGIVDQSRQRAPNATLIAYGPHVQADKLDAAKDAGVGRVLTNGQFDRDMSAIFTGDS